MVTLLWCISSIGANLLLQRISHAIRCQVPFLPSMLGAPSIFLQAHQRLLHIWTLFVVNSLMLSERRDWVSTSHLRSDCGEDRYCTVSRWLHVNWKKNERHLLGN